MKLTKQQLEEELKKIEEINFDLFNDNKILTTIDITNTISINLILYILFTE